MARLREETMFASGRRTDSDGASIFETRCMMVPAESQVRWICELLEASGVVEARLLSMPYVDREPQGRTRQLTRDERDAVVTRQYKGEWRNRGRAKAKGKNTA